MLRACGFEGWMGVLCGCVFCGGDDISLCSSIGR